MKIRFGLVLAMAMLVGGAGCASSGGSGVTAAGPGSGVGQGERPRDTENTRAAERALDAGDATESEAEARMHYEQAMASAQAAITEDGTNPLAHRLAAMAALSLEDYPAAGRHFDRAAELRPLYEFEDQGLRERTWIDLYQKAAPLVSSGDYEEAAVVFEDANAIYTGRPEAMITLGQIYAQLRQHDKALENLDRATALVESDLMAEVDSATAAGWREQVADVPTLRAQVLADAGRFEEAITAYRDLSAADPGNLELTRGLATLLLQSGDEAGALQVYEELLGRPDLSGQDYYAVGVGFYQAEDYERAARAFGEAAEVNKKDRDALEMWARSLQLDSAYAKVPPVAERWIELDPNSQNAYLILAQAANLAEDQATTQRAIQTVEALEVSVDQMQARRFPEGGALVSGSVTNKSLEQGTAVTLRFTFYGVSGDPIGAVTETVAVGGEGMAEVFQVEFDSADEVAGYGYELTVG